MIDRNNILFLTGIIISVIYWISIRSKILRRNINLESSEKKKGISIIIPARNEELNLIKILEKLKEQTAEIDEIIVVNDNSDDNSAVIVTESAKTHNNLKLINLTSEPPDEWIGKSWALWNGVQESKGDILIFFDADVEPGKDAVEHLLSMYIRNKGLLSVWPYQRFEKLYEHLGLAANLLITYASNNFGFLGREPSGCFGPAIITSKEDYLETGGHREIKKALLDDIQLAKLYLKNMKKVNNFLGGRIIKFRMYPDGLSHLFEGLSKNMSLGASTGYLFEFIVAFIWFAAMLSTVQSLFSIAYIYRYFACAVMIYALAKPLGNYRWYDALFFPVHFLFFLVIFVFSLYKSIFKRKVKWKGRKISVK